MVNTEDFIKRLEIILEYYGLNASSFADKIGVQRSSLSHLLSGRNKPSLDFILKILDVFPEIDLYWVLNGKGSFPISDAENKIDTYVPASISDTIKVQSKIENSVDLFTEEYSHQKNKIPEKLSPPISDNQNSAVSKNNLEIDRIVIFYKNGSFKTYSSE